MIGNEGSTAYLSHLLVWSLPVLLAQLLGVGLLFRGQLWRLAKALGPPVLFVTLWLTAADHLAITAGIWRFGAGKNLGFCLLSVPIEEILFFLITNLLVALGFTLFSRPALAASR